MCIERGWFRRMYSHLGGHAVLVLHVNDARSILALDSRISPQHASPLCMFCGSLVKQIVASIARSDDRHYQGQGREYLAGFRRTLHARAKKLDDPSVHYNKGVVCCAMQR